MVSIAGRPQIGRPSVIITPSGALADMFKALSDSIRLTILGLLRKGDLCELDLADLMEMLPRELLSQHLAVLRQHGLIKVCRDNVNSRWKYYSIDKEVFAELGRQCSRLFDTSAIGDKKEFESAERILLREMAEATA